MIFTPHRALILAATLVRSRLRSAPVTTTVGPSRLRSATVTTTVGLYSGTVTSSFAPEIIAAITTHMNGDHGTDGLTIVRAFAEPEASSVRMTGLDGDGGDWEATVGDEVRSVRVPWTEPITERAEIRREIVRLYDAAAERLGLPPRERH